MRQGIVIIAVVLIAVVVIGVAISGIGAPGSDGSMSYVFLKDGQEVTLPLAFIVDGVPVDSVKVTLSWVASLSGVDTESIGVAAILIAYTLSYSGQMNQIATKTASGIQPAEGSLAGIFDFSALDGTNTDQVNHWTIRVVGSINSIATDVNGQEYQDSWEGYVQFSIQWIEGGGGGTIGEFSLVGTIVKG